MKPRTLLALIFVTLGLIIAAVPQNTTKPYKLTAGDMLAEVNSGAHFIAPESVADMIINKDPSLSLIDVRNPAEFEKYSLPGAVNIPSAELLSEKYTDVFDQDVKMNVLYSNGSVTATEAWMILRQLGYENIYVLEGGLNYWFDAILNPQKPSSTSPDEELAKYDFRKSAGAALGGGGAVKAEENQGSLPAKPAVKIAPKKKKAAGGC
jgi:rhodanese-related sulfurtransferase